MKQVMISDDASELGFLSDRETSDDKDEEESILMGAIFEPRFCNRLSWNVY
jgi:hypothetical protein